MRRVLRQGAVALAAGLAALAGAALLARLFPGPALYADAPARSFSEEYAAYVAQAGEGTADVRAREAIERTWMMFERVVDDYDYPDPIAPGDGRFNEALYRRAVSEFERALENLGEFRETQRRLAVARERIRDPLWWKELEEQNRLDRIESRETIEFHRVQSYWFGRVFATLERIDRPQLARQSRAANLRQRALRMYGVNQIALGRYPEALRALIEYAAFPGTPAPGLAPDGFLKTEQEWPLHYYLSRAYAAEFRAARRNTSIGETELRELRRKKNLHYLRAVHLKFGRESAEFETTLASIHREELGSPRTSPP